MPATGEVKQRSAAGVMPALFDLYFNRGEVQDKISGYQQSLANYNRMDRLAAALGDDQQRLRARVEQGFRLTQLGRLDEALVLHRSVADGPAAAGSGETALRNTHYLAIALRMLGRYDEALAMHDRYLSAATPDSERYFNGINSRGQTLWRMGRYQESIDCYQIVLDWSVRGTRPVMEATAHNNLGLVYDDMERLAEARAHHEQALRLREAHHDIGALCSSYLNLGNILVEQGDHAGGMALWDQAGELSRRLGDTATEAMIETNKADVLYRRGEYPAAAAMFLRSLGMKEALNLRTYLASSLVGLAKTHYELRADPASRALCRGFAKRAAALDAAKPQQRAHAREILDALDGEERDRGNFS
jgi:tetratricopeptide (TPR) repeat protein